MEKAAQEGENWIILLLILPSQIVYETLFIVICSWAFSKFMWKNVSLNNCARVLMRITFSIQNFYRKLNFSLSAVLLAEISIKPHKNLQLSDFCKSKHFPEPQNLLRLHYKHFHFRRFHRETKYERVQWAVKIVWESVKGEVLHWLIMNEGQRRLLSFVYSTDASVVFLRINSKKSFRLKWLVATERIQG